ncbi:hypothetical protein [Clostridium sp. D33t1_170424_F3]|uniref:hypothetical protein n=1 Tax=Clostridium sp. D33t1_170424_F3 TaxID=2787099 RepID=UPI0018A9E60C|nr:hypothetical protein [Clostridium sp. D33t1_170424_F3]
MNRSRVTLVLMEQVLMLLAFALAAALCVQTFVYASRQSIYNEERDRAVQMAQTAVEIMKSTGGTVEQAQLAAAERMGGQVLQENWQVFYDQDWREVPGGMPFRYSLRAVAEPTDLKGFYKANVQVVANQEENGTQEVLFQLTAAWQEVSAHAS